MGYVSVILLSGNSLFLRANSSNSRRLSTNEWLSVLKLSKMWGMTKPQTSATQKLQNLLGDDPVRRIIVAKEYDIQHWLSGAYLQLASRKEPLNAEEGSSLGYEIAFKIVEVRERAYENMFNKMCGDCRRRVVSPNNISTNRRTNFFDSPARVQGFANPT